MRIRAEDSVGLVGIGKGVRVRRFDNSVNEVRVVSLVLVHTN